MKTATVEISIEEQLEDLKAENEELKKQVTDLEEEKEDLEYENKKLEWRVDELEKETAGVERLTIAIDLFADPSNWDGNTWRPVMNYIETDPQFLASKALG